MRKLLVAQVGRAFASTSASFEWTSCLHQVELMIDEEARATNNSVEEVRFIGKNEVTSTGNYLMALIKHRIITFGIVQTIQFEEKIGKLTSQQIIVLKAVLHLFQTSCFSISPKPGHRFLRAAV